MHRLVVLRSSGIKTAKLFLLNAGLLTLIVLLLRVTLTKARIPVDESRQWEWLHRIYRVWWLSECLAIILADCRRACDDRSCWQGWQPCDAKEIPMEHYRSGFASGYSQHCSFHSTGLVRRLFLPVRTTIHTVHGWRVPGRCRICVEWAHRGCCVNTGICHNLHSRMESDRSSQLMRNPFYTHNPR